MRPPDLGVLYEMEQQLSKTRIPATIIWGAYYMRNWDMSLVSVYEEGKLYPFFPADFSYLWLLRKIWGML